MVDESQIKDRLNNDQADGHDQQNIDEPVEIFIQSLKNSQRRDEIKEAFDKLVQTLTLDAFAKIKEIDDDAEEKEIKNDLQETVATLAVLADNYLQTRNDL